jgi:hypothetical protein
MPDLRQALVIAARRTIIAEHEARSQEARGDRFRDDAARYHDIRGWLRLCENTPEGRDEFYRECSAIIFPGENDDE